MLTHPICIQSFPDNKAGFSCMTTSGIIWNVKLWYLFFLSQRRLTWPIGLIGLLFPYGYN